jgi:hypothetical protein
VADAWGGAIGLEFSMAKVNGMPDCAQQDIVAAWLFQEFDRSGFHGVRCAFR